MVSRLDRQTYSHGRTALLAIQVRSVYWDCLLGGSDPLSARAAWTTALIAISFLPRAQLNDLLVGLMPLSDCGLPLLCA